MQNLSSMDADWMYSSYHYSHPILTERLKALGWTSERKVSGGVVDTKEESYADAVKKDGSEEGEMASGREL